jgi:threonine dehydrogenase-like Zn-dependent dehydrogenase
MNLMPLLAARERPVTCALIGAGKFGAMFLAQVPNIKGLQVSMIADLDPDKARKTCRDRGLGRGPHRRHPLHRQRNRRRQAEVDVVIEATGNPLAGTTHALAAIEAGRHIVMVNVEADVLVGPALAARRATKVSSIQWPTATSRRWWRKWWTGRAPPASPSRRRARAPNTCPPITMSPPTTSGRTTA